MTLKPYVSNHISGEGRPNFEWSDWKCRDYYMWDPEEGYLSDISDAAALGLLLATMEWISSRLLRAEFDEMPEYAQLAGWAYMLEPEACLYYEPTDDLWRGPVRAPLAVMAVIMMDALYCRGEDPEVRVRTFWMSNLARHVLEKDTQTYEDWLEWAVARMESLHPRSQMPSLGLFDVPERFEPPVGPSAFTPDATYVPANARQELYAMLAASDQSNPFILFDELKP